MTIFGPDISSYEAGLDLSRLPDASFVFAKCSEGTYYTDPDYQGWRSQAAQLGKVFAWYHFLSTEGAAAQVAHTKVCVGDPGLPGMLDFEPTNTMRPTLAQALAYADAAHAAGLNLRLVYLPEWYWAELGSPSLAGLTSRGLYLVSSNYPGGTGNPEQLYPGDSGVGWRAYGGLTPLIWQYTDKAADGGKNEDFNAFRGSVAQLRSYLGATTTGGTVILGQDDLHEFYNYGEEDIVLPSGAVMHKAPIGNMLHGSWVSLNDRVNGPVLAALTRIEADVKALVTPMQQPPMDTATLAAAIAADLLPKLPPGGTVDPTALASAVVTMQEQHGLAVVDEQTLAADIAAHFKVV